MFGAAVLSGLVTGLSAYCGRRVFQGPVFTWKERLASVVVFAAILMVFSQNSARVATPEKQVGVPILTSLANVANADIFWEGTPHTARTKSLAYVWMQQLAGGAMDEPDGYGPAAIKAYRKLSVSGGACFRCRCGGWACL